MHIQSVNHYQGQDFTTETSMQLIIKYIHLNKATLSYKAGKASLFVAHFPSCFRDDNSSWFCKRLSLVHIIHCFTRDVKCLVLLIANVVEFYSANTETQFHSQYDSIWGLEHVKVILHHEAFLQHMWQCATGSKTTAVPEGKKSITSKLQNVTSNFQNSCRGTKS